MAGSRLQKFGVGVGWGGLSVLCVAGFQILFLVVLARLLEPADFGIVAIANLMLRFLSYFAQLGVVPALVQKPVLTQRDIAAALVMSLAVSMASAALAVIAAPLAGSFFAMSALPAVVGVLAVSFVTTGFSAISTGILRREMRFKALSSIDALSYVFGYGVVGLGSAYMDLGVWALVAAALSQSAIAAVLLYATARHSLSIRHGNAERAHFLAFGGKYSLIGFCEFLSGSIDVLAIGKVLGEVKAGYYNRSMAIANLPVQQPATVMIRALFPVLSAAGIEREKQAIGLQLGLLSVGSYAFATGIALSAAASAVVGLLLGSKWLEVVPILQIYALSVGPRFMTYIAGTSLDAIGALNGKLAVQAAALAVTVVLVFFALPHGPMAVAGAVVVVEYARIAALLLLLSRLLRFRRGQWVRTLAPLLAGGVCSAVLVTASQQWAADGTAPLLLVVNAMLAAAVAWLAALALCRRWVAQLDGALWVAQRVPRLHSLLAR